MVLCGFDLWSDAFPLFFPHANGVAFCDAICAVSADLLLATTLRRIGA